MREWMRAIRKSEQLTQSQLARLIGMNITSVNKYELGKIRPSPDVAKKIACGLNFEKYGRAWTDFFDNDLNQSQKGDGVSNG